MLRRPRLQHLLPLSAPVALLGLATYASWTPDVAGRTVTAALASLGAATAITAFAFAMDAARVRRAFAHLRRGGGAFALFDSGRVQRREQQQHETVTQLRRQVEQLSAIRDLALIANDDVSLAPILERALTVLGGLLDAREIVIFLADGPERDALVAVAHRVGERTRVSAEGDLALEPREARRALDARRTVVEPSRGGLRAAALLVAEGEVMGALEVRLAPPPAGTPAQDPLELARMLEGLAKHIALAIRKPALYDRAVLDGLTGLYTKRHFLELAQQHMAQRRRRGTPLSLIIIDIDHFKRVNDVHGHVAGDAVLAEVARRLRGAIRGYDQAFRFGGEEMIILAPDTALEDAAALAERLRKKIRQEPVKAGEVEIPVTASFGVAELDPDAMKDPAAFIEAADQHLYAAKRNGRDQVRSALNPVEPAPVEAAPAAPAESEAPAVDAPAGGGLTTSVKTKRARRPRKKAEPALDAVGEAA
ncbi:MAG: GGDEF domain-containing protein [Planctomycetes bacterium]|nr:GGDEF domain-containing protein [Planctomycetota bacterium]